MITDVPSAGDFQRASISFLDIAWSSAIGLLRDLEETRQYRDEILSDEEDLSDRDREPFFSHRFCHS